MKSLRWFGLLLILGIPAVAANAQTPVDPQWVLNDPTPCPQGVVCISLEYEGPSTIPKNMPLIFSVSPPDADPDNTYTCSSNVFTAMALVTSTKMFTGCEFYGTAPTDGTFFNMYATGGPINNINIPSDFTCGSSPCPVTDLGPTPEPGTGFLYLSGALALLGVARRRLRQHSA